MILDKNTIFSEAQAVTVTAPSTNVIDLLPLGQTGYNKVQLRRRKGFGEHIPLLIQIMENFNNLGTLTIEIQSSDDDTFGTGVTTHLSMPIDLADAQIGWVAPIDKLPRGISGRYLRLRYVVAGGTAPTTGQVTAAIVAAVESAYRGNP
jgi:hypothetical protein